MDIRKNVEVCYTPGEYEYFKGEYDIVVVIDVLRATSAICAAFENGIRSIIPVATIEEAQDYKDRGYLVGAERKGQIVEGFDFGNSPTHILNVDFKGKTIIHTTSSGTQGIDLAMSPQLAHFLQNKPTEINWNEDTQDAFAALDDIDILHAVKQWQAHSDPVLSRLAQMINNRTLLQIELSDHPVDSNTLESKKIKTAQTWDLDSNQASYFVFSGKVRNTPYKAGQNPIVFIDKSGKMVSFDSLMEAPYFSALLHPVIRHYLCFPKL